MIELNGICSFGLGAVRFQCSMRLKDVSSMNVGEDDCRGQRFPSTIALGLLLMIVLTDLYAARNQVSYLSVSISILISDDTCLITALACTTHP